MENSITCRAGSLFTGAGGIDLAFNLQTAWACDIEPGPQSVISRRMPGATLYRDVTRIPDLLGLEPVVLVHGGSPCQSNSVAGKRAGIVPESPSGLWSHQIRVTGLVSPDLCLWENVKGALSAKAWTRADMPGSGETEPTGKNDRPSHRMRALGRVVSDMLLAGYDCAWTTVGACDVGAPHRRERVFVLGVKKDARTFREKLSQVTLSTDKNVMGQMSGHVLGDDVKEYYHVDAAKAGVARVLLPTPAVNDMSRQKSIRDFNDWRNRQKASNGSRAVHGRGLDVEVREAAGETRLNLEDQTGVSTDRIDLDWGRYTEAIDRAVKAFGPHPCPVEPGRRRAWQASARFLEWMMGFPEGWVTDLVDEGLLSYDKAARIFGNAVVPRQAGYAVALDSERLVTQPDAKAFGIFNEDRDVWVNEKGLLVDDVWPKNGYCVDGIAFRL